MVTKARFLICLILLPLLLANCVLVTFQKWSAKYDSENGGWYPLVAASSNDVLFSVTRAAYSTAIFTKNPNGEYVISAVAGSPYLAVSANGKYMAYSDDGTEDNNGGIYESYENTRWKRLVSSDNPLAFVETANDFPMAVDNDGNVFLVAYVETGQVNQNGLRAGDYLIMVSKNGFIHKLLFSSYFIYSFSLNNNVPLLAVSIEHDQLYELVIYNYLTNQIVFSWDKKDVQEVMWSPDGRVLYFIAWSVAVDPNINGNFVSQVQPSALYMYKDDFVIKISGSFHNLSPGPDLAIDPANDNIVALLGWQPGGVQGVSSLWLLNSHTKELKLIYPSRNQSYNGDPFGFSLDGNYLAFEATLNGYDEIGYYDLVTKKITYPYSQNYFSFSTISGTGAWNGNQFVYAVGYKPDKCKGICRLTFVSYDPGNNKLTILAVRPGAKEARMLGLCGVFVKLACG